MQTDAREFADTRPNCKDRKAKSKRESGSFESGLNQLIVAVTVAAVPFEQFHFETIAANLLQFRPRMNCQWTISVQRLVVFSSVYGFQAIPRSVWVFSNSDTKANGQPAGS